MPITFIAVQCFQCSTMQVKQQKKSSNKWNCVVCNEKQSVRKIFAQGGLAKDVRSFVQSFNMSRKFAEENLMEETLTSPLEEIGHPSQNYSSYQRKRRNDWSEYLDPDESENNDKRQEVEDEFEPDIVTELPKDMFTKPKLRNYAVGMNTSEGKKSYSPIFAKRKPNQSTAPYFREEDEFETQIATELPKDMFKKTKLRNYTDGMNKTEGNKSYSPTFAKRKTNQSTVSYFLEGKLCSMNVAQKEGFAERSERSNAHHKPYSPIFAKSKTNQHTAPQGKLCSSNVAQNEVSAERNEPRNAYQIATTQATASKWSEYLTLDEDDFLFQGGKDSPELSQPWKLSASGNQFDDQRVEEDVHPDFIW